MSAPVQCPPTCYGALQIAVLLLLLLLLYRTKKKAYMVYIMLT